MHNPGSIPDDNRLFTGADLIVVFEAPYSQYVSKSGEPTLQKALQQLPSRNINNYGRKNYAYMFSGLSLSWSEDELSNFINSIKGGAQYLFLTDVSLDNQDIYGTFGSHWEEFVRIVSSSPAKSL